MNFLKILKINISINTEWPQLIFARTTHLFMVFRMELIGIFFFIISPSSSFLLSVHVGGSRSVNPIPSYPIVNPNPLALCRLQHHILINFETFFFFFSFHTVSLFLKYILVNFSPFGRTQPSQVFSFGYRN